MLNNIILLLIIPICFSNFIVFISVWTLFRRKVNKFHELLPLSIIIAAKNEEMNIDSLVTSLSNQDYPKELYEIIIVDDASTDKTFEKASEKAQLTPNLKVLHSSNKCFKGKRAAIQTGIDAAKNNYLVFTDADCIHKKGWLKSHSKMLQTNDVVIGISPFIQRKSLINLISCFENFRNSLLTFALTNIGLPYNAVARNLSWKKSSFLQIGGFSETAKTISGDDDMMIQKAVKHNLKIGLLTEEESIVHSYSKETLSEYINQRARHTSTSYHYLLRNKIILALWHIINLACLSSLFLSFFYYQMMFPFVIKLIIDLIMIKSFDKKFGYNFPFFKVFYLQIFYEIFLVIHFFNAKFYKFSWK